MEQTSPSSLKIYVNNKQTPPKMEGVGYSTPLVYPREDAKSLELERQECPPVGCGPPLRNLDNAGNTHESQFPNGR